MSNHLTSYILHKKNGEYWLYQQGYSPEIIPEEIAKLFADENFDTGEIIAQETFSLMEKETMGMLFSRTNFMVAELLAQVLIKYKLNGEIPSRPQDQGDFIKAPNIKGDFYINWNDSILKIERLIRASNPFYNALTNFRGGYIRLIAGNYKKEKHNKSKSIIQLTISAVVWFGLVWFSLFFTVEPMLALV